VPSTFITDVERISGQIIPFLNTIISGDEVLDIGQKRWNDFNRIDSEKVGSMEYVVSRIKNRR